jgi:hypothetical protein
MCRMELVAGAHAQTPPDSRGETEQRPTDRDRQVRLSPFLHSLIGEVGCCDVFSVASLSPAALKRGWPG